MDRSQAQAPGKAGKTDLRPPAPPAGWSRRLPSAKVLLFGFVLVSLLGILAVAAVREVATTANARTARPALAPPRPPLTAAEEAYALALWPIHNEVKTSALKMTFGGISYKLGDIDRAGLKAKIDVSSDTYRRAAARIAQLTPPA